MDVVNDTKKTRLRNTKTSRKVGRIGIVSGSKCIRSKENNEMSYRSGRRARRVHANPFVLKEIKFKIYELIVRLGEIRKSYQK